jgi:hypothetical protein
MAYYVTNLGSDAANTSQATFTGSIPPDAKAEDLLVMCVTTQNFFTDIIVNTAGWTKLGQPKNGNGSNAVFWKIYDGTETTVEVTTTSGGLERWATVISVYRDADTTSPIVAHGGAEDDSNEVDCASLTPTSDDDIFVTTMVGNTSLEYKPLPQTGVPYPYELIANVGYRWSRTVVLFLSSGLLDTQATGSSFILGANNSNPSTYSLIIKNKAGGQFTKPLKVDYSVNRVFGDYCVDSAEEVNNSWVDASGIVSTIDGDTVITESNVNNSGSTAQYSDNENPTTVCNSTSFIPTATIAGEWSVWYQSITEDLTGKVLHVEGSESNANRAAELGIILFDSSNNYSVFTIAAGLRSITGWTLIISESTSPKYSSATACDVTDITKIGTVSRAGGNTSDGHLIHSIKVIRSVNLVGGTPSYPIDSQGLANLSGAGYLRKLVNAQGLGQVLANVPVKIGDGGTTATYYDGSDKSLEFGEPNGVFTQHVAADLSLAIDIGAIDTVVNTTITAGPGGTTFDTSDSSASGAYDFANTTVAGMEVSLNQSIALATQKFSNCGFIAGGGGTYTDCLFTGSSSTTSALSLSTGADITGSDFVKGSETYAVELTNAGSYDLTNCTFTGYTTDLNVSAVSGTVEITLAQGQSQPTFTTAGATVTFVTPQLTASITGLIANSRVQIYNVTTATEISNSVVAGTSLVSLYTEGTDYTDGDTVRVRVTNVQGTTAYKEYSTNLLATAFGWSALVSQELCPVYNNNAIDGSTITLFAADYVDNEVDVIVASNFTSAQWFAWWKYNLYTEQGLREFFGGVTAEDAANFRINTAIVDIKFDKTTSANIYQNDNARIYRDDSAYPVKNPTTGGGAIDIVWKNQIFIAETTTSGLTAQESADLAIIKTRTGLIPATV